MIAIHKLTSRTSPSRDKIFLHPAAGAKPRLKNRLVVAQHDGMRLIPYEQIIYLQSDGNYTHIYLSNGNKIMASRTLKHFEDQLPTQYFIRIHQKYCVAIDEIVRINFSQNGYLALRDGTELVVSRTGKKRLHALLE